MDSPTKTEPHQVKLPVYTSVFKKTKFLKTHIP